MTEPEFKNALEIFKKRVTDPKLMCDIFNTYAQPDPSAHNCIGCEMLDGLTGVEQLLDALINSPAEIETRNAFKFLLFACNEINERIKDIFELLNLPESTKGRHFTVLKKVRRWTNFFKHPNAFGYLIHHPEYVFENNFDESTNTLLVVDDSFVEKYWSGENSKGLIKALSMHHEATVVLPQLDTLMDDFCNSLEKFVEIVTENPVYVEILEDKTTVIGLYDERENEEEESE